MKRLNELAYTSSLALCFVEKNIKEGKVADAESTAREAIEIAEKITKELRLDDESWRIFKYWSRVSSEVDRGSSDRGQ
jgi:hypothetical protein